jgi:hypothetical protein
MSLVIIYKCQCYLLVITNVSHMLGSPGYLSGLRKVNVQRRKECLLARKHSGWHSVSHHHMRNCVMRSKKGVTDYNIKLLQTHRLTRHHPRHSVQSFSVRNIERFCLRSHGIPKDHICSTQNPCQPYGVHEIQLESYKVRGVIACT